MNDSIGAVLGQNLALLEEQLWNAPEDTAILEKLRVISETYLNLRGAGLGSFEEDFKVGYELGKADMKRDRPNNSLADGFDLGQ